MTKPDPTLTLIAARFTRYDVEKSGKGGKAKKEKERRIWSECEDRAPLYFPTPVAAILELAKI